MLVLVLGHRINTGGAFDRAIKEEGEGSGVLVEPTLTLAL